MPALDAGIHVAPHPIVVDDFPVATRGSPGGDVYRRAGLRPDPVARPWRESRAIPS